MGYFAYSWQGDDTMIQHNIIFDAHGILLKMDKYIKDKGIQFEVSAVAPSTYEETSYLASMGNRTKAGWNL